MTSSKTILSFDLGQRNLAYCKIRYVPVNVTISKASNMSSDDIKSSDATSKTPPILCINGAKIPTIEILDWKVLDIGTGDVYNSIEGTVSRFVSWLYGSGLLDAANAPDTLIIERQLVQSNPKMAVISHVLQALYMTIRGAPTPAIKFINSSVKFSLSRRLGIPVPHDVKEAKSAGEKYRWTKENAVSLAEYWLKAFNQPKELWDVLAAATKKDDLADCMGLAVTHMIRSEVPKLPPIKRKQRQVASPPSPPTTTSPLASPPTKKRKRVTKVVKEEEPSVPGAFTTMSLSELAISCKLLNL